MFVESTPERIKVTIVNVFVECTTHSLDKLKEASLRMNVGAAHKCLSKAGAKLDVSVTRWLVYAFNFGPFKHHEILPSNVFLSKKVQNVKFY